MENFSNCMVITDDMVLKRLEKLRSDKSPGGDNISPRLLKEISEVIVTPVRVIFQKSIDSGLVPEDWRTANVCPFYETGKRDSTANYRPISLTSQLSKLLETMIRDVMMQHLETHNLIRNSQHGFRGGHSWLTNLLLFLDTVSGSIRKTKNYWKKSNTDLQHVYSRIYVTWIICSVLNVWGSGL